MHDLVSDRLRNARSRLLLGAADRAIHAYARVRYAMPDASLSRFHLRLERDVAYGPRRARGDAHLLDVYVPTRPASRRVPVVMYVHGGGFAMLSKDTHRLMAVSIARAGYVVFNINYRQGHEHRYPAPLEDACRALLWVQEHCDRFGGDPARIAVAGESAGANLVTALAVASSWRRPEPFAGELFDAQIALRAVVAAYGFLDLGHTTQYLANPKIPRWSKGLIEEAARTYLGRELLRDVARSADANPLSSPLRVLESGVRPDRPLPPFFASVGTRDPLIRCTKRLKSALDALGTPCELLVAPGEIHGYDTLIWRPAARTKWRRTRAFLERYLEPNGEDEARAAQ
jgi:acetyl esterase